MTWIVGMPTMWGYSIGISDIRVTLADDSEHDCLQKIYPIAQSITLGFAGSVRIGFQMIAAMRQWLHCDRPDHARELLPEKPVCTYQSSAPWQTLHSVDLTSDSTAAETFQNRHHARSWRPLSEAAP